MRTSSKNVLIRVIFLALGILLANQEAFAQQIVLSGKVLNEASQPLAGASILLKNTTQSTSSNEQGEFEFRNLQPGNYIVQVTYVGYLTQEKSIVLTSASERISFSLVPDDEAIEEVVIIGYAGVKSKDLTGAVTKLNAEDFNRGNYTSPDQLIQGKVSGVQMLNNSGQPGGATTVQIRGNSAITGSGQPLYVVDGVALDGNTARPSSSGGIGTSPSGNPLTFLNPNDIESMEVLKDASATAIYGSRAAYGVVLITTKRGKSGDLKLDVNLSSGLASIMKRVDVLNADQYREMLNRYSLTAGDFGTSVDALGEILQVAPSINADLAFSGGNENARYRASAGYQNQDGIIKQTNFEKFAGSFNGNFKMLESKRLGLDIGLIGTQTKEDIAPITTDAGFTGSLIGQALMWNPTEQMYNSDGSPYVLAGSTIINPVAMLEAYDDKATVSTLLANLSPYYKFNDWLEYRFLGSVKYSNGVRRASTRSWLNLDGIQAKPEEGTKGGYASYANNETVTSQLTHTLTFDKEIASGLNLNAVVGFEYMSFSNKGMLYTGRNYGDIDLDYTDVLEAGDVSTRTISSFNDPTTELQSYFLRAIFNYQSKYLLTATFRRDGSTKFGENNKYGNFPSFSAAWNISDESFLSDNSIISNLKLRAGWGITGNQEFPAGASYDQYSIGTDGALTAISNANPNLKWQSDQQTNIGLDFGFFNDRLTGTVDYFHKRTTDLLYPVIPYYPNAPGSSVIWMNLDGEIENKGVEIALNGKLIQRENLRWNAGVNFTFLDNMVTKLAGIYKTGVLSGQGMSNSNVEIIQEGLPMFAMVTREFLGFDDEGFSMYTDDGYTLYYLGNPNPDAIYGFNTDLSYKKFSFVANFNGMLGRDIYNNTANSVTPITNLGSRNISLALYESSEMESLSNPITSSSRYIEDGSYLKLANASISYRLGNVGKNIKNLNVSLTGTNLFVITKYTGFDPEINTERGLGELPSLGIDYIGYPSSRTFSLGFNFSL
ncbi:SusC/RagA family TonB-linked outer membrane protein [Sphingobacterium hungaricum]|uniref:SusC/RagA family TonB-linked outer membrane protein n=1 Tax=Sphingobacterium hungaricum TaxID=2082723 RepID=A0A928UWM4_9SPHI|nr:SusC/RagA family TonB-linked outer membrane protein [Sphingobacterium hungaricum]MBE8714052.1 SusC/RagA family TonB-linked outer membrane protein [Sphingobacterium hungaricum]